MTIVSLFLNAPVFTKLKSFSFNSSTPTPFFAERKWIRGISFLMDFIWFSSNLSTLFATINNGFKGYLFIIFSISILKELIKTSSLKFKLLNNKNYWTEYFIVYILNILKKLLMKNLKQLKKLNGNQNLWLLEKISFMMKSQI